MVTGPITTLAALLGRWDGQAEPAAALETFIAGSDELPDLSQLMTAANADFGDAARMSSRIDSLTLEQASHLARRSGWIVQNLLALSSATDRKRQRIEAALAAIAVLGSDDSFWRAAAGHLEPRGGLVMALESVLAGRGAIFSVSNDTPAWEREHLAALQQADQAQNWVELAELCGAFPTPQPDPGAAQAARGLALLDRPRLIRFADSRQSWADAVVLLQGLPVADALGIAIASRSNHVRFTVLERVIRRERRFLSTEEETALRNLLLVLSKDRSAWPAWLRMCNYYPVRQPHIQAALGRALARCDEQALGPYIDSISLMSTAAGREVVGACLSVFRGNAGLPRRQILWRKAFERWQAWNFGAAEGVGLVATATSEIDYAVTGWLIEGGASGHLVEADQEFELAFRELERTWHASVTDAVTGFFRLLSRHRLLVHALDVDAKSVDWLEETPARMPPAAASEFVRRRYNVR